MASSFDNSGTAFDARVTKRLNGFLEFPRNPYLLEVVSISTGLLVLMNSCIMFSTDADIGDDVGYFLLLFEFHL